MINLPIFINTNLKELVENLLLKKLLDSLRYTTRSDDISKHNTSNAFDIKFQILNKK